MFRRLLSICSLLTLLAACLPAPVTPLPVSLPTAGTEETPVPVDLPSPLPEPTATATPDFDEILPPPDDAPEDEPGGDPLPAAETPLPLPTLEVPVTQAATEVPQPAVEAGAIQLLGPGPLSKVVSPVKAYGYAIAGSEKTGRIELFAEDGRLLAWQRIFLNTTYRWVYFYWELPFESNAAGQLGRLSISVRDEYDRLLAVNSVHLLLMGDGFSVVNPPGGLQEPCVIEQPEAGKRLSGGVLAVAGKMRPFNSLPLVVELIDRDGEVIGSQLAPISPAPDGGYVPFGAEVPYTVSGATWVRLTVRQLDDRIGGTMYVYSQELLLYP